MVARGGAGLAKRSAVSWRRLVPLLVALGLAAGPASAQEVSRRQGAVVDTWSAPSPGLRYLRRTLEGPPVSIHAVVADLTQPGVRVIATPQAERWATVGDFARTHRAAVAVNGGFWSVWQRPTGVTAGGGAHWSGSGPDADFGHFGVRDDGRAVVNGPGQGEDERSLGRLTDAVSGRPVLVRDGEPALDELDTFPGANQRQPRTAVGVSRDGRRVILVVADGRQSHSRGLTLYQLARVLVELGAHRALNLDGGGSSTMYVAEAGGVVSSPSRGRWVRALGLDETATRRVRTRDGEEEVFVRGVEREVMNHLAILGPPPPVVVAAVEEAPSVPAEPAPEASLAPVPIATFVAAGSEPLRLGRTREVLYPLLWVGVPLVSGLPALWLWRRRRRSRALHSAA